MKINPENESNERLFRLETRKNRSVYSLSRPFITRRIDELYRGKGRINYYSAASGPYFSVNLHHGERENRSKDLTKMTNRSDIMLRMIRSLSFVRNRVN